MRIDVISIFPQLISDFAACAIVGRAIADGKVDLRTINPRDFTNDRHRSVDDEPFGGGPGMVMKPEPIVRAIEAESPMRPIFALAPSGRPFDQAFATRLSKMDGFTLLCGRYEGIDQRVIDQWCEDSISIGDFVLSGGEVGALCVIEATVRLLDGVMGNENSATSESFADGLLEYPQYTRPAEFRGLGVPAVLQSGNHELIRRWRYKKSLELTCTNRPDLIEKRGGLSKSESDLLDETTE